MRFKIFYLFSDTLCFMKSNIRVALQNLESCEGKQRSETEKQVTHVSRSDVSFQNRHNLFFRPAERDVSALFELQYERAPSGGRQIGWDCDISGWRRIAEMRKGAEGKLLLRRFCTLSWLVNVILFRAYDTYKNKDRLTVISLVHFEIKAKS